MNKEIKEIKLEKRKPTFNYILNDLAFESLKFRVVNGIASNQDKFDFDYQLKLKEDYITNLQKENKQLKELKYKFFDSSGDEESFTLEDYLELGNKLYDLQEEIERLSKKYNKSLELLQDFNMPCDYCNCKIPDEYCEENCSVDSECYKKCWDKYIEIELKENK